MRYLHSFELGCVNVLGLDVSASAGKKSKKMEREGTQAQKNKQAISCFPPCLHFLSEVS